MSRTPDLAPLLDLGPAAVALDVEGGAEAWRLKMRHAGGTAAVGVVLEDGRPADAAGWAVFGDNVLDLLPGESRTVEVAWRDAPSAGRALRVDGWNVAGRHVR